MDDAKLARIVSLTSEQRERSVDAVTRAFLDDPMWSCVLPSRGARATLMCPMWDALIGFAQVYGEALTTLEGQGSACWIAPGKTKMTLWKMLRTGMALPRSMMRLPKEARGRFFGMMRLIDEMHKELMPGRHWYLLALGVAPEAQGRGIGRRLIAPILARSDEDSFPCYLETQTEANIAFYRKSGFDVIDKRREPVCELPVWFMRRESGAS